MRLGLFETRVRGFMRVADRQQACQNHANLVNAGEIAHHGQISLNRRQRYAAMQVVGSSQYNDAVGLQVDNISLHTLEHLAGGLPADPAIEEIAVREILVQPPAIGDAVAQEDDTVLSLLRRTEPRILFSITRELSRIRIPYLAHLLFQLGTKVRIGALQILPQLH